MAPRKSPGRQEQAASLAWHIITCEYPPRTGGVSDYTLQIAEALAASGDEVHVWCPDSSSDPVPAPGVTTHRALGRFHPADLRRVGEQLDQFPAPRRILVQWVPHGYGLLSMNVPFCAWLWNRAARHQDRVEIMLHEPYLGFRPDSMRQNAVALVHRLMTIVLLRSAHKVWMSIPGWERIWRPYALSRPVPFEWLPIPSGIPVQTGAEAIQAVRRKYAEPGGILIGHFGTYGGPITQMLEPVLLTLAQERTNQSILLMGSGSERFRESLVRSHPQLSGIVRATGALTAEDISFHVSACDLFIQPYPDGVSTRRTSFMAALSHGKPVVSTTGRLSEDLWAKSGAVLLAPAGDAPAFIDHVRRLMGDANARALLGQAARDFYLERFDVSHVIATLRSGGIGAGN